MPNAVDLNCLICLAKEDAIVSNAKPLDALPPSLEWLERWEAVFCVKVNGLENFQRLKLGDRTHLGGNIRIEAYCFHAFDVG